jgi:hypothetical protein
MEIIATPMTTVVPFERSRIGQVVALWRLLHPDWTWLDNPEKRDKIFESSDAVERIGYVIQREDAVIASVFGACWQDKTWPRNRFIHIEARPEDMAAEWLGNVLASFIDADRGQPDTWHVADTTEILLPVLAPLLHAAGFVHHSIVMQTEWSGESVTVVDPRPVRLERYAGGDREIDRAIVDLHNRSYRFSRLVPPADLAGLWKPWLGLEVREFVLAVENYRLVGYAEWLVTDGKPYINSLVAARSHWGTAVASALGTQAMQILLELGHHKIRSSDVRSNNAASLRLQQRFGWKVASERAHTFVRKL